MLKVTLMGVGNLVQTNIYDLCSKIGSQTEVCYRISTEVSPEEKPQFPTDSSILAKLEFIGEDMNSKRQENIANSIAKIMQNFATDRLPACAKVQAVIVPDNSTSVTGYTIDHSPPVITYK